MICKEHDHCITLHMLVFNHTVHVFFLLYSWEILLIMWAEDERNRKNWYCKSVFHFSFYWFPLQFTLLLVLFQRFLQQLRIKAVVILFFLFITRTNAGHVERYTGISEEFLHVHYLCVGGCIAAYDQLFISSCLLYSITWRGSLVSS